MSQSPVSKFGFRAWLFGCAAIVFVFVMASCCPPALIERPVEKNDKYAEVEKNNP